MLRALKVFFLYPLLLSILIVTAGCSKTIIREEFTESYQVRPGTMLFIDNPDGSVSVTGWEESKVEVKVVKESLSGREALDQVDVNINLAETMQISTFHPEGRNLVTVDYIISLPIDLLVATINCANGDVSLDGITGNPVITTSNGTITVQNVNGMVKAKSINGDINISGARSLGDLQSSNGTINAELYSIYDNLTVKTSNGSITLAILPSLELVIDAKTSNGNISAGDLNLVLEQQEQTALSGSLNGGEYMVKLETSNGSIDLKPLK